jgi:tetratricopeptide (TPR) repeat protein
MSGIEALYYLQKGQIAQGAEKFKDAYNIGTFGLPEIAGRAQDAAAQVIRQRGISKELKSEEKELIVVAIDGMKKSLELEPQNVRFMMMLGTLYLISVQQDPSYLAEADLLFQQALELNPTRQELYFALGQVRLYQGRNSEVLPLYEKAIELNDKVNISHWNYGVMAISVGQKEAGEAEIKKAVQLGHSYNAQDIEQLINIFTRNKDWAKVISLYEEWIALPSPSGAQPYAQLAAVYAQLGEKQKAKDFALQAAQIDPSYKPEAEEFIKQLGL